MKKGALILTILISMCIFGCDEDDKIISVTGDNWCPYSCCNYKPMHKGYIVDLLRLVYEDYYIKYNCEDWEDAITLTTNGQYDIVIGPSKAEGPDLLFPIYEAGASQYVILVNKKTAYRRHSLKKLLQLKRSGTYRDLVEILPNYKFGYLPGEDYSREINKYIKLNSTNENVIDFHGKNATIDLFNALIDGELDVIYQDFAVTKFILKDLPKDQYNNLIVIKIDTNPYLVQIGFNPVNQERSFKLIKIWDTRIVELRNSGKLKEILQNYNLDEWRY